MRMQKRERVFALREILTLAARQNREEGVAAALPGTEPVPKHVVMLEHDQGNLIYPLGVAL
jgi:hypothetical protein